MEEELNENELEERFYSMLHYADDTQTNKTSNQDALNILENAPRSTVRRYWRTSGDQTTATPLNTPFQKVNTPKEAPQPVANNTRPKEERRASPVAPLSNCPSIFQSPVPTNLKRTIIIIEPEDDKVVELESSDEDEVIEVALPPKPTITIESSDDEDLKINTPTKAKNVQEKGSNNIEREVKSASPVPSIVSSVSDDFIRGDCIALNISSSRPDNPSFDFNLHETVVRGSTHPKKKKKKKNKETASSKPIFVETTESISNVIEECFATPKSKAKKRKLKTKSKLKSNISALSADIFDSDSNHPIAEVGKNQSVYIVTEKSLPCADVYESDSNPSETPRPLNKTTLAPTHDVRSSDSSVSLDNTFVETQNNTKNDSTSVTESATIDLTGNLIQHVQIEENIIIGNVSGFTEPENYVEEPLKDQNTVSKFGSTKVPAILYENLDFDNLKGKDKVCKNRRYSLTTLRAEMEKFYNESWGGEDFNHREIQKNMSRDKSLWAIDPKDRMPSLSRKKFNVTCHYCNRAGHRDDMCRQKPPVCFMCGNIGHMEPRCPSKICVNCGSPNHMYSTMCRNCSCWGRIICAECGQLGHPASHCPDIWRRYHNTINIASHLEENRFTKKNYQLFCSGCTRRGHLVHTCRLSLPFSGLPINSPYVQVYAPVYKPTPDINVPNLNQNIQKNRQQIKNSQDSTISSASTTTTPKSDRKRQSKSPTVHETPVSKKRSVSVSEITERNAKSPVCQDSQRKISQSKEPTENKEKEPEKTVSAGSVKTTEPAPDFIPIFSNNHDKKGQVIQDNEVSDTSDVVTSARIYVTNDIINKLKTPEGENWLQETTNKFHVTVVKTESNSFLSIKGNLVSQEAFQSALRDWVTDKSKTDQTKYENEADVSQQTDTDQPSFSSNIPKNRCNVLRKINKALDSLKEDFGEPNALFTELQYLQNRHEKLLKRKEINPKQLEYNRTNINNMLKKLNIVLLGQAELADGSIHLQELYALQAKLICFRQKNIPIDLRKEIGEHYHSIFTAIPRNDYGDLLKCYNIRQQHQRLLKNNNRSFKINSKPKMSNGFLVQNQQQNRSPVKEVKAGTEATVGKQFRRNKPLVEKTMNKLVFYHRRLVQARPNDTVLKKTRNELVRKLHTFIASLSRNANTTSKNLKKMKKVQEQAQLFLKNV